MAEKGKPRLAIASFIAILILLAGCSQPAPPANAGSFQANTTSTPAVKNVPHQGVWGIYELNPATNGTRLVYGSSGELYASALRLNSAGSHLVFAQKPIGASDDAAEIFVVRVDGSGLQRITDNAYWDLYPAWSPDGSEIAFLSMRGDDEDLDIYVMDSDGGNARKLYDSGSHDADIDWAGDRITFTSDFRVWTIKDDGTTPLRITSPADSGRWGTANLPVGDYDPRLRPDGAKIVFERLENPDTANGGYNIFTIGSDGSGEARLTSTGYAQGLASWSHSGGKILYVVAAAGDEGKYDIYSMNADGTDNHDITPDYYPAAFLCHSPIFSKDDSRIYFIGQWWG
jgi:Tol biopolymer transport system component